MNKLILVVLLLSDIFCIYGHEQRFGYPSEKSNGVVDENENWGGDCDTGRRQSPVDLNFDAAVTGHFPPLKFSNYDDHLKNPAVTNTGHSIQINNPTPSDVILSGGGLPGKFLFDQMHFHWGSEHTINERRYGLELHMVHHEQKYATLKVAAAKKRSIAVLGILFHVTLEANPLIDIIIQGSEAIKNETGKPEPLKSSIILHDLLPKNRTNYFRYEGSLTTPGCGEAVIWTVFTNSLSISVDQLDKLKTLVQTENGTLTHNFRTLQPLNARTLVYVSPLVSAADHQSMENGSTLFTSSSSIFVFFFILQFYLI